jgi:hypothetical protein
MAKNGTGGLNIDSRNTERADFKSDIFSYVEVYVTLCIAKKQAFGLVLYHFDLTRFSPLVVLAAFWLRCT